jgi:hypothetical protein
MAEYDMRFSRYVPVVAAALTCAVAALAQAEIYTWVDAKGQLNIGNLPPPDDARVTKVVHETPPHANPYNDAARDAAQQAELDSLNQRVAQLQNQLAYAAQAPAQPPVIVVPVAQPMPVPVPYPVAAAAPQPASCDYGWNSCDGWWGPGFFPYVSYVYAPPLRNRFPMRGGRGDHVAPRGPTPPLALSPSLPLPLSPTPIAMARH